MLILLFKREHLELMKSYQKKLLKFFIGIQSNLIISAGFIFFVVLVVSESTIDKLFTQSCVESLVNSTRLQVCPSLFATEARSGSSSSASFFSWKHEILNRKTDSHSDSHIHKLLPRNQSYHRLSALAVKLSPIEDVYIMLICVSLISFFAALIVPVVLVKPSRKIQKSTDVVLRKQKELSVSKELLDEDDSGGFAANKSPLDDVV